MATLPGSPAEPDQDRTAVAALRERIAARPAPGRIRMLLARRRRRHALTAVLALLAGAATLQTISNAESARAQWERAGPVPVATRTLPSGHVIAPGDFELRELPTAATPGAAASGEPGNMIGRTVSERVLEGEILVEERIAPGGLGEVAGQLPPGHRALALPVAGPAPPLEPGDHVDLYSVQDPYSEVWSGPASSERESASSVLARDSRVLDVNEVAITVAVPEEAGPPIAAAIATSAVVPALSGR